MVGVERAKLQCHVPTITLITLITIANKRKDLARPIQTSTGQPCIKVMRADLGHSDKMHEFTACNDE